jgi:hypothetical protein
MQASITIGDIEVALATPAGALEKAVAERYASFLGASEAPVCSLTLELHPGEGTQELRPMLERSGEHAFQLLQPGFSGRIDLTRQGSLQVETSPGALDSALRMVFGLLAARHETLLLRGVSILSTGGAHIVIGPESARSILLLRPVVGNGLIAISEMNGVWTAASTPFCAAFEPSRVPLKATVARLWSFSPPSALHKVAALIRAVTDNLYLPGADQRAREAALHLTESLVAAVPWSELGLTAGPTPLDLSSELAR